MSLERHAIDSIRALRNAENDCCSRMISFDRWDALIPLKEDLAR